MSDEKEIKFPLSKKVKAEFVADYEKIFFKVPPHNIKDEKLVEVVNANREKITGDEGTQSAPSQEGNQNAQNGEGGTTSTQNGDEGNNGTGAIGEGDGKVTPEQERAYQIERFKELHGTDADESLPTDEINALNITKENENFIEAEKVYIETFGKNPLLDYSTEKIWSLVEEERKRVASIETLNQEYFDLFGKKPLSAMTTEQIDSAVQNERKRQNDAKDKAKAKTAPIEDDGLEHDSETQMVIVNKKNPKDKCVINKSTFDFLKHDFDVVPNIPKELKNK